MEVQKILDKIGALKDAATVQRVFGEPQTIGERTIIPVAAVRTCMGFGFGKNKRCNEAAAGDKDTEPEEGGGGGGGAMARPVGVVEVTSMGTQFIPIKTPPSPLCLLLIGMGLGMCICTKKFLRMYAHRDRCRGDHE